MSLGPHDGEDGSLQQPGRTRVGRAALLVVIVVVVGYIVLHRGPGTTTRTAAAAPTTTVRAPAAPPPTTVPPPTTAPAGPAHPPSEVKVLVGNGSGVTGLAGSVTTRLRTAGYDTLAGVNATQKVTASVVYYTPAYQREAATLAQALSLAPTVVQPMPSPPPVQNLGSANVVVVAGPDLSRAAATTTPTTAPSATTAPTATTAPAPAAASTPTSAPAATTPATTPTTLHPSTPAPSATPAPAPPAPATTVKP